MVPNEKKISHYEKIVLISFRLYFYFIQNVATKISPAYPPPYYACDYNPYDIILHKHKCI